MTEESTGTPSDEPTAEAQAAANPNEGAAAPAAEAPVAESAAESAASSDGESAEPSEAETANAAAAVGDGAAQATDAEGAAETSAGDVPAPEGGGKKKRKRKRKKKKKAEGAGEQPAQAFSRWFGKGRSTAFKAGDIVAGIVRSTDAGTLTVDLFGRSTAYVDAREAHAIEPLPEPKPKAQPKAEGTEAAPAPAADAAAADAAPRDAAAEDAAAIETVAADATEGGKTDAPTAQPTADPAVPAVEARAEAAPKVAEAGAEATSVDGSADGGSEVTSAGEVEAESSEADPGDGTPEEPAPPGVEPADLEPSWPDPGLPAVGTVFRGRVGSVAESGHMALVNRAVDRPATKAGIRKARDEHKRVQGVVFGFNRGGFDVLVSGVRCFCPARSMSLEPIEKPASLLGQKLEFSVPPSRGGKSIIVSRRGILERELRRAAREHMKTLVVGEKVDGRVTQVRDYGLLVDIGNGVEGLVHQSEVSWSRGDRPADVAKPGDEVKVEILKVSPASRKDRYGKVSLSMRRCLPDPWDQNAEALKQGVPLKGKVVRTTEFGAFVELIPGIEGLLHVSELGRDVKHANQVLSDGQEIDVVIERKDKAQRRLSLSRLSEADLKAIEAGELDLSKAPASLKPGKHIRVKITRTEHHGLFAQVDGVIGKRGRGYIPNRELPISSDKKKKFSQGSYVDVKIIGTDRDGGLRLSIKGLLQDEERSAVREYRKEAAQQGGFGTFADLLKQKLGN